MKNFRIFSLLVLAIAAFVFGGSAEAQVPANKSVRPRVARPNQEYATAVKPAASQAAAKRDRVVTTVSDQNETPAQATNQPAIVRNESRSVIAKAPVSVYIPAPSGAGVQVNRQNGTGFYNLSLKGMNLGIGSPF